ncbi:MAG: hypothetical protein JWO32_1492 [Bacteroidetes bacterium]|nr:hypothetical protein [Bacteroidota bacterium]
MRILLLIIVLSSKIYGQKKDNYFKYYDLCNQANKLFSQQDYNGSLHKYDSAFRLVHYQHVSDLLNAAVTAVKAQNKNSATKYLRQAILNGISTSELSSENFIELTEFKQFKQLRDSSEILRSKFLRRTNRVYSRQCDSLFYVDQVIIRNVKTLNPVYKIDLYVYASERQKYDSINFQYLLKLIEKYGFPSEEKIGPASYEGIKLVIHHSARMPVNKDKIELFKAAVSEGEYLPTDFAWMYDQFRTNSNESPFFYFQVGDTSKLTVDEKNRVDKNRKDFGLRPLADDKLKRTY